MVIGRQLLYRLEGPALRGGSCLISDLSLGDKVSVWSDYLFFLSGRCRNQSIGQIIAFLFRVP